jgi:hypothetical protein
MSHNMNTPDRNNAKFVPDNIDILPTPTLTPDGRSATAQSVELPVLQSFPADGQDPRAPVIGVGETTASTSHVRI